MGTTAESRDELKVEQVVRYRISDISDQEAGVREAKNEELTQRAQSSQRRGEKKTPRPR
jgi:hypothetical protein